jgi:hypothetical protein
MLRRIHKFNLPPAANDVGDVCKFLAATKTAPNTFLLTWKSTTPKKRIKQMIKSANNF